MKTEQPEALRLADWLEHQVPMTPPLRAEAAAELRRLHSLNQSLMRDAERYRFIRDADRSDPYVGELSLYAMESLDEYIDAAIAKAKEQE